MRIKMETKVELWLTIDDVNFVKSALIQKYQTLLYYISERTKDTIEEEVEKQTRQERDLENYKEANKILLETIDIYKQKELEIQDVEMNEFRADIKDMIEKHKPRKVGRPKGSKNAK